MYKAAILIFLAFSLPHLAAENEFINIAPGALCQVWHLLEPYNLKPITVPKQSIAGQFIDRAEKFDRKNLINSITLAALSSEKVFIAWSGFIRISQSGQYSFSVNASKHENTPEVMVLINNKPILELQYEGGYFSIGIPLEPGMAHISIYFLYNHAKSREITLQYKTNSANEPVKITPAMLFHQPAS